MHAVSPMPKRYRTAGFSLIEMMVALVLGLILLGAVVQVYLSTKLTFVAQDQKSAVEEGGRFALDYIARDVRMAGLTGCGSRTVPGGQALPVRNHLVGGGAYPYLFTDAIRGLEASNSGPAQTVTLAASNPAVGGTWNAALPAAVAALAVPGSDVLLFSGSQAQVWPLVDPFASGAQMFVQLGNDIAQGDILFVTDCSQGVVFQATSVNPAAGRTNVTGSQGGTVFPGNSSPVAEQGPNGGAFRRGAVVARASSIAYFIGRGTGGVPSLFRASLLAPTASPQRRELLTEELINGVESMQLRYGIDVNGDFGVDGLAIASAVADWAQVRSVQVGLLMRGADNSLQGLDTQTYNVAGTTVDPVDDLRQRRVFSMTISLRNRLP